MFSLDNPWDKLFGHHKIANFPREKLQYVDLVLQLVRLFFELHRRTDHTIYLRHNRNRCHDIFRDRHLELATRTTLINQIATNPS